MFSNTASYTKLKMNLKLAINRLKLCEKKKTEQAMKARKEIAEYIQLHKDDRARIRVEHIIREDYCVEAYELLEMYCDLLLARFGLIQQMKEVDPGLEEAVNSILWAAPRLVTDIQEFKVIADNLTLKYGKLYADSCRANQFNKVNPKLMNKLSVEAPPKILVERYLIEIAKAANVPFSPDPNIMREDEVAQAEAMLIDFQQQGQGTLAGGGGNSNNAGNNFAWMYPNPHTAPQPQVNNGQNYQTDAFPPPYPSQSARGEDPIIPSQQPPKAFDYPSLKQVPPPPAATNNISPNDSDMFKVPPTDGVPSAPPPQGFIGFNMPHLPDVPLDAFSDDDSDDDHKPSTSNKKTTNEPDFEDLNRRFEELKKRH